MKKILSLITVIPVAFVTFFLVSFQSVQAAQGTLSIHADQTEIAIGSTVNVTVTLSCDTGIDFADFNINYDAGVFESLDGKNEGSISLSYASAEAAVGSYSWTVALRAIEEGSTRVGASWGDRAFIDGSDTMETFEPGFSSVELVAVEAPTVEETTQAPTQEETSAPTTVTNEVPTLAPTVAPTQAPTTAPTVAPSTEPTTTTTAPTQAPTEPSSQEEVTVAPEEELEVMEPEAILPTAKVDEVTYYIVDTFSEEEIPAGYVRTVVLYAAKEVPGVSNKDNGLNLIYLVAKDTFAGETETDTAMDAQTQPSLSTPKGAFYVYNEENDSLFSYHEITDIGEQTYVVLEPGYATKTPTGLKPARLEQLDISGYMANAQSEFFYFYGMDSKGAQDWYCYDMTANTIQRMNAWGIGETTGSDSDISELEEKVSLLEEENASLAENAQGLAGANGLEKGFNTVFMVVTIAIVAVLLGIIVYLFIKESKRAKKEREIEDRILAEEDELDVEFISDEITQESMLDPDEEKESELDIDELEEENEDDAGQ